MRNWALGLVMAAAGAVSCTPPSSPPATPSSAPIESAMSESAPPGSALPSSSPEPAADLKPLLDPSPQIMRLPSGLAEVSGLAVASDRTVYAHDDEHGIVYEIDVLSGEMGAIFALGHPTIRGDFEGIATYDGLIYLITSDGLLFETQIGAHKERVPFNSYSTGIGEFCEIEGLTVKQANNSNDAQFLILCKTPRKEALKDKLNIFEWSFDQGLSTPRLFMSIEIDSVLTEDEKKRFNPSAIEWHAESRTIFLVSARNRQVLHLSETGDVLSKHRLKKSAHPQSEGLTIMPNGDWIIADEKAGKKYGRLTRYPSVP